MRCGVVRGARKLVVGFVRSAVLVLWSVAFLAAPQVANAYQTQVLPFSPLVVRDDPGGYLVDRVLKVRALRETNTPVEIRGTFCHSSCTLFLGLNNVCVSPDTRFGFHGPSRSGAPLDPVLFERASKIIAAHYPEDLQNWYMEIARFRLNGVHHVTGAHLIAMGVPSCDQDAEAPA